MWHTWGNLFWKLFNHKWRLWLTAGNSFHRLLAECMASQTTNTSTQLILLTIIKFWTPFSLAFSHPSMPAGATNPPQGEGDPTERSCDYFFETNAFQTLLTATHSKEYILCGDPGHTNICFYVYNWKQNTFSSSPSTACQMRETLSLLFYIHSYEMLTFHYDSTILMLNFQRKTSTPF